MMRGVFAAVVLVGAVALAVVLASSGAFSGPTPSPTPLSSPSSQPSRTPTAPPVATPPTPRPSASPIDTSVVADGTVVPLRSADLTTSTSGLVQAIYVREGSEVNDGQLLLRLDQTAYQDEINRAEYAVTLAEADLQLAELQLEELPADASQGQIDLAQANLRAKETNVDLAQSTLTSARNALDQTELRAPFAGTVASMLLDVGEQAIAGQTVVTIGDTSTWLIETTDVSELEVVRLAIGDRASVTFTALPGHTIEGTVDRIQGRGLSEDGSVVYAVAIRPDAFNPQLRWGMSATVRIRPSG